MKNVIIGAGVFGLATALSFREALEDVTIIECGFPNTASRNALGRLDPILKGAGSAGHLSDQEQALSGPLKPENQKKLALESFLRHKSNYKKLVELSGIDYYLEDIPTIQICFDEDEFSSIEDSQEEMQSLGFNVKTTQDYKEIESYQEGISSEIFGVALITGSLFLDSNLFISCMRKSAETLGAKIINDFVEELFHKDKQLRLKSGEIIDYENLIICAGPWTNQLISSTGETVDMFPAKGEIIKLESSQLRINNHLHGPCSVVKKRDGLIWIGATYEDEIFDSNITLEAESKLINDASLMLPILSNQKVVEHTACVRPATKDGMPRVGELIQNSGIFVATGGGGWGIMQSFLIGDLLKNLVIDEVPSLYPL